MMAILAHNYFTPHAGPHRMATDHPPDRRAHSKLEQHIQTVLISVITGALMFAANYFYSDNKSKAVLQTQLEVLTAQVVAMSSDIRAMSADMRALQTNYVKREELKELEARLRYLEAYSPGARR